MVEESIEAVLHGWSPDPPHHFDGKYSKIYLEKTVDTETGIGYIPKPYQRPHPPIAIPGMSRNSPSMRTAARRGHQPSGHCLVPVNVLADNWRTYEEARLEAGCRPDRSDWKIARSIFLADTTKDAQRRARTNTLRKCAEYIRQLFDKGLGRNIHTHEKWGPETLPPPAKRTTDN